MAKAVVAIVNYQGKILLGKKKSDSKKSLAGKWHIPGEGIEDGESDESALIRCLDEEAKLKIKVNKFIASGITPTGKTSNWYECFSDTDNTVPGSDLEAIKWIPKNEVIDEIYEGACRLWPQKVLDYFSK